MRKKIRTYQVHMDFYAKWN